MQDELNLKALILYLDHQSWPVLIARLADLACKSREERQED